VHTLRRRSQEEIGEGPALFRTGIGLSETVLDFDPSLF